MKRFRLSTKLFALLVFVFIVLSIVYLYVELYNADKRSDERMRKKEEAALKEKASNTETITIEINSNEENE
ncbi:MAG: hypothetical protein LBM25_07625 [Bacteroidales bacterium]|jgi:preprotein translocase subunit SecG|nr:hypothetical protein [Bacteroidales bacterium]